MKTNTNPSAVVVGGGTNGLGLVRALGQKGVSVTVVDKHPGRPAMHSRYSDFFQVAVFSGVQFVEELAAFLQTFSCPPVLYVTEEAPLLSVSEHRQLLNGLCQILLPEHQLLLELMSKNDIDRLTLEHNLARARTVHLKSEEDLAEARDLQFPCILKPGNKNEEYGKRFKKGYKLSSFEEVCSIAEEILPVLPDLVVQEWIEGSDRDIYFTLVFLAEDGQLLSAFSGRKLRCWPLPVGGTASCGPADDVHDELVAMTVEFFNKVGFVGLGGVEYKRDPRDGKFYLIEPTVSRTDFQHEVAVLNGQNIPYAGYCYHAGLSYEPESRTSGYAWLEPVTERWSREHSGISDTEVYGKLRKVGALFRWSDPAPWLYSFYRRVSGKLRHIFQ